MGEGGYRNVAYRISEVRGSQKSIPLAYQVSMVLSPTCCGGKVTFPLMLTYKYWPMTSFMDIFLQVIRTLFQQIVASVISHSPHQVQFDHSLPSRPVIPTLPDHGFTGVWASPEANWDVLALLSTYLRVSTFLQRNDIA